MREYLNALRFILDNGERCSDRTGVGTIATFELPHMRFDLSQGFPLVTTKKLHLRSIFHELLWFLRGETNIASLHENGVTIWDEWADENGDLGPVYGAQWRNWPAGVDADGLPVTVDQIRDLVEQIRMKPNSRQLLVTAWNPAQIHQMALPPCHTMFQVCIMGDRLSMRLYQRSGDFFLGVPFNIASYALLTMMLAHVTGYKPGKLIHTVGNAHIYLNHLDQVNEQLARSPREIPTLRFAREVSNIDDFRYEDFIVEGYDPLPAIAAPIAV